MGRFFVHGYPRGMWHNADMRIYDKRYDIQWITWPVVLSDNDWYTAHNLNSIGEDVNWSRSNLNNN